jgi:hypothetical protein
MVEKTFLLSNCPQIKEVLIFPRSGSIATFVMIKDFRVVQFLLNTF